MASLLVVEDEPNIRETIAFPLNGNAQDLLMGAPSEVSEARLRARKILRASVVAAVGGWSMAAFAGVTLLQGRLGLILRGSDVALGRRRAAFAAGVFAAALGDADVGVRDLARRSIVGAIDVMLEDEKGYLMAVVPASRRVELQSLEKQLGRRLVLAFQPHRYTRTRDLIDDFLIKSSLLQ